jgi:hypothetical protein
MVRPRHAALPIDRESNAYGALSALKQSTANAVLRRNTDR